MVGVMAVSLVAVWIFGSQGAQGLNTAQLEPFEKPWLPGELGVSALFALVLLNALFVAAEAAVDTLRPVHVKHARDETPERADRLQEILDEQASFINAALIGGRLARLITVFFVLGLGQGLATHWVEHHLGSAENPFVLLWSVLAVAIPVGIVNILLGEVLPRSFAMVHPIRVSLRLYRFLLGAHFVFWIPAKLLVAVSEAIRGRFGMASGATAAIQAEEEIKVLMETAEESGEIESDERELIHSVFEFNDTIAREIMTPRVDLDAAPVRSDAAMVADLIRQTGHSRIPLYEETDDQIVGIIHAKDLFAAMLDANGPLRLRTLMRPATFVPEGKRLHELLAEMRTTRAQMVVVQDEFGGTAGIVTIEDIVEQLVGDIVDEYDNETPDVVSIEGGWLVQGMAHLDDANDQLGSEFESEEFDTIGGFVFGHFGRQPRLEETIDIEGFHFTVMQTDGRRLLQLKIERMPDTQPELDDEIP